jgi:hypothetical protein
MRCLRLRNAAVPVKLFARPRVTVNDAGTDRVPLKVLARVFDSGDQPHCPGSGSRNLLVAGKVLLREYDRPKAVKAAPITLVSILKSFWRRKLYPYAGSTPPGTATAASRRTKPRPGTGLQWDRASARTPLSQSCLAYGAKHAKKAPALCVPNKAYSIAGEPLVPTTLAISFRDILRAWNPF